MVQPYEEPPTLDTPQAADPGSPGAPLTERPLRVSIVEDNEPVRESLATLINSSPGFCCISSFPDCESALEGVPAQDPDVVLMDINLPGNSGIHCVSCLKRILPHCRVVMLTAYDDSDLIFQALQSGAIGYLLKQSTPQEILDAIQNVMRGGAPMSADIARKVVQSFHNLRPQAVPLGDPAPSMLSPREQEVLGCLARGFHYKEIAESLNLSYHTVRTHIRRVYEKLQVHSRSEIHNQPKSKKRPLRRES